MFNEECLQRYVGKCHLRCDPFFIVGGVLALERAFAPPSWVHLALWLGLDARTADAVRSGKSMLAVPLAVLAWANFVLMLFNLLPAYPLDGGHTLDAWLGVILGPAWATRIVASLGLIVAGGLAYLAFPSALFLMLVALFVAMANWQALQSIGRWRR